MDGMEANVAGVNEVGTADLTAGAETTTTGVTDAGAEVASVGAQGAEVTTNSVGVDNGNATGAEEGARPQSAEDNSRYAAARRKAEADYKQKMDKLNNMFKQQFGQFKNPETGAPIQSAEDYVAAFSAQQRKQQEAQLQKAGFDPKMIENMVNNNPAIREAKEIIAKNQQEMAHQALEADIKAVGKLDPDIKSLDDLAALPSYPIIVDYVAKHGLSLVDAYKLANGDKIAARQTEATKQAAINSAKSTSHLSVTAGVATSDGDYTPIPASMVENWKAAYPELSMEELTKKYNAAL